MLPGNRPIEEDKGIFLNEFYELLGLETIDYGDYLSWSTYKSIKFYNETVILYDGLKCTVIHMIYEPTYDFENY